MNVSTGSLSPIRIAPQSPRIIDPSSNAGDPLLLEVRSNNAQPLTRPVQRSITGFKLFGTVVGTTLGLGAGVVAGYFAGMAHNDSEGGVIADAVYSGVLVAAMGSAFGLMSDIYFLKKPNDERPQGQDRAVEVTGVTGNLTPNPEALNSSMSSMISNV